MFQCFSAQETSRLKRASSLLLVWLRALFQVGARALPRPLGRCCTARKLINADLLENTTQAWMGWPGFGRQGAEEGEMPQSASAVTNSP